MTKSILIVDDQQLIRLGLTSHINKLEGYTLIAEASNGIEALAKVKQHKPDFVIMDLAMPEMSGLETTQKIKAIWPETKIIIFTFWDDEHALFEGLSSGADGFCNKTLGRQELNLALKAVENGRVWVNPQLASSLLKLSDRLLALRDAKGKQLNQKLDPYLLSEELLFTMEENRILELLAEGKCYQEIETSEKLNEEWVKASLETIVKKVKTQNTVVDLNSFKLAKAREAFIQ